MSGTYIDSYSVDIINAYRYFVEYFENPAIKRFKTLPSGMTIYSCQIRSQLSKDRRYIFAFINTVDATQEQFNLSDVKWSILQTRTIPELYQVPLHSYNTFKPSAYDLDEIVLEVRGDKEYKYNATSSPFKAFDIVLLLAKNQTRPYSQFGTIQSAIENYNNIFAIPP